MNGAEGNPKPGDWTHIGLKKLRRRELVMLRRHLSGDSLQQIADDYGISRQRVHQILTRARRRDDAAVQELLAEELPQQASDAAEAVGAAASGGRHG